MTRGARTALIAAAALAFGAAFSWPLLLHLGQPAAVFDWDQLLMFHVFPVETLRRYHQLPLWNPYMCGGMPMLANPQSRFLSPFLPLSFLFGPVAGLQLEIPLHLALTFGGGYWLGRTLKLSPQAALAVAAFFPACSAFTLHFGAGHDGFYAYAYAPWVLGCLLAAVERGSPSLAAAGGAAMALMIGEGGTYPAPHAMLWVPLVACGLALKRRDLRPLWMAGWLGVAAALLSAVKLLPMLALMRQYPRLIGSPEIITPAVLWGGLFARDQDLLRTVPWLRTYWLWHEYGCYLGPIAAGLALFGARERWRKVWPFAAIGLLGLTFAFGDFAQDLHGVWKSLSPWGLLRRLPPFQSQHVPTRFLFEVAFSTSILAGFGVEAWRERLRGRARWLPVALVAAGVLDCWLVGPATLRHVFDKAVPELSPAAAFTQTRAPGGHDRMYPALLANEGTIECYDPLEPHSFASAAGDPGYRGEAFLEGAGAVRQLAWTPNALTFEVDAPAPTRLVVNQNNDGGWRLAAGAGGVEPAPRLTVRVEAGHQIVKLVYAKESVRVGGALSLLGVALVAMLGALEARRRRPR